MLSHMFLQILNMSLTGSFVIVFVLVARLFLKKAPKVLSYALWSVVWFRLVCPFSFESLFSLLPARANFISHDIGYTQTPKVDTGLAIVNHAVNSVLPPATPYASVNPLQIWIEIGSFIWLLGIAVLLVYSLVALLRLKKRLHRATLYKDNIFFSNKVDTAFVMGIFRPYIYLPSNLNDMERGYIILHEQTHIKRFDHLVKLISFFVLAVHWFNPLVWVAFFASGKDMEMSCDEAVIKSLGYQVKKDYSASLLSLATGRRMIGGTPLAFGEGDTKRRIKNVLNYKKPALGVTLIAGVVVVCVVVGLMANPKENPIEMAGVHAIILEIDRVNETMTVEGTDENSIIGDRCLLTWEANPFVTVATNSGPRPLSLDDFSVGDPVLLFLQEVQESYPTRAKAKTIQLQPKERSGYSAENLWQARTAYVGNNSAVSKLIQMLPAPEGVQYDHFRLHTSKQPYQIEIEYSVSELGTYDTENGRTAHVFQKNALLLLALVDNADSVRAVLTDSKREIEFVYDRQWAQNIVGKDVRDYSESPEKLQELLLFTPNAGKVMSTRQEGLAFFVKPDEPAQVIGETAAIIWLKSYMQESTPQEERIDDYKINEIRVISEAPSSGQEMNSHYIVGLNYDSTTASERFASGEGDFPQKTFKDLFRELHVKDLGGGRFQIVNTGEFSSLQETAES